jgi:hypothetical protein
MHAYKGPGDKYASIKASCGNQGDARSKLKFTHFKKVIRVPRCIVSKVGNVEIVVLAATSHSCSNSSTREIPLYQP